MQDNKGFTLIELVIVIAVLSIVSLMTVSIFSFGIKSNNKNNEIKENTESVRLLFSIIEKDIRISSQNLSLEECNQASDTCFLLKDSNVENGDFEYHLKDDGFYRNKVFIIDRIKLFEIQKLEDEKGIKIIIEDAGEKNYDQVYYFRD